MPPAAAHHIASITDGFSFAYLKESYVASLLMLVRNSADNVMPLKRKTIGHGADWATCYRSRLLFLAMRWQRQIKVKQRGKERGGYEEEDRDSCCHESVVLFIDNILLDVWS